jgi:hypothetical protein
LPTALLATGIPSALLTILFGALLWVRLDTVWSEERIAHWLSLGALGAGTGVAATAFHSFIPTEASMQPALVIAVVAALGWWSIKRGWRYW